MACENAHFDTPFLHKGAPKKPNFAVSDRVSATKSRDHERHAPKFQFRSSIRLNYLASRSINGLLSSIPKTVHSSPHNHPTNVP
ncbi:hypothetical protein L596_028568 [Steinernema carpocapsae]|uniref:Uncharacterized protein n=1 Tax=Steinernema carpocapsae TaxID=34508 RepID=A0A4U5LZR8_STECR|nr:hypothetical protein L596_028568 [Steinernema carpocapsae]